MELELKKQQIKYKKPVFHEKISHEKLQEVIVSDSLPDIFEITDTYATAFLRGKDSSAGKVTIGGSLEANVIFSAGDGNKTRCIPSVIPFTVTLDGREITENCEIVTNVSVISAETKLVNPRKVLIKINLCIEVTCYLEAEANISCDVLTGNQAECLVEKANICVIKNVNEKTFTISDEYCVGSKAIPGEILAYSVKLFSEEIKPIGTKLIVSGRAASKVIYLAEDSEEIECAEFSTAFSQIVELSNVAENHKTTCKLMLTGAYFSIAETSGTGERGIVSELHGVIQCTTAEKNDIDYLSDIFCTNRNLTVEKDTFETANEDGKQSLSVTAQGTIPAAVAPEKVIATSFRFSEPHIKKDKDIFKANVTASVKILYCTSDKQLRCAVGNIECTCILPAGFSEDAVISVNSADEIYVSPVGMNFEVRLPITFNFAKNSNNCVHFISQVSYDEKEILTGTDRPSITLYRTKEGDTIWSLCKRFSTERKLLIEANELTDTAAVPLNELLIIPKSR